ncbi:MAG: FCD domain-containing protein [Nocardioides sp.]|uniref:FadR/GntR family transcriptional regulator n=1 Tax=Nocardioides sp. TaxID=35761 RepID=UPI0039E54FE5
MGSERARETVRRLQGDIMSGRWPINSRIPNEAELAVELGVGRSTVREAVRSLAHLGMLEPAPGRGTFVRSLNPVRGVLSDFVAGHSWADVLAVRRGLEVQAAELAARRVDAEALARLGAAQQADVEGSTHPDGVERGRTPGQFHALIVEAAGNRLLSELYAVLMATLREGVRRGRLASGESAADRRAEHAALLAAIAAGNPAAAAAIAARHADHDFVLAQE